jgi:hypothetical protein
MDQQISTALAELPGFPMAATKPSAAHSRRCSVCNHPDRIWIELKFIEWRSPTKIAQEFDLYDRDSIYHHAHATNLFELRRRNILCIYENLLERIPQAQINSRGILHAISRVERAASSRLPTPAAELQTTVTRDTALVFDPKSESEYDEDQENDDQEAGHQVPSAPRSTNSESPQRQHTPAHVPHSKGPQKLDSRHSFINKMRDPETSSETKFDQLKEQVTLLATKRRAERMKPPH